MKMTIKNRLKHWAGVGLLTASAMVGNGFGCGKNGDLEQRVSQPVPIVEGVERVGVREENVPRVEITEANKKYNEIMSVKAIPGIESVIGYEAKNAEHCLIHIRQEHFVYGDVILEAKESSNHEEREEVMGKIKKMYDNINEGRTTNLELGRSGLVITLNKIPEVYTQTTCEGHINYCPPILPVKDGWVHFVVPKKKYTGLVDTIEHFCYWNKLFNLNQGMSFRESEEAYTISANLGQAESQGNYSRMNEKQRAQFNRVVKKRKIQVLKGWNMLDELVEDWVRHNINLDVESLPYQELELVD